MLSCLDHLLLALSDFCHGRMLSRWARPLQVHPHDLNLSILLLLGSDSWAWFEVTMIGIFLWSAQGISYFYLSIYRRISLELDFSSLVIESVANILRWWDTIMDIMGFNFPLEDCQRDFYVFLLTWYDWLVTLQERYFPLRQVWDVS